MQGTITRAWLIDQLRFYRRQLYLRRLYSAAAQAHEMIAYVLDHGTAWSDCIPAVTLFITEADQAVQGSRSLPYYP